MNGMGQPYVLGDYSDHFQCTYDEALLSPDGETVIERTMGCVKGEGPCALRFTCTFTMRIANLTGVMGKSNARVSNLFRSG
jgi:hypothetical protein